MNKKRKPYSAYRKVEQLLGFTYKVVVWLVNFHSQTNSSIILEVIPRLSCVLETRGPIYFLDYVKRVRSCLLNYLSGNKVNPSGVGLTKDGIPLIFGNLIPVLREINSARFYLPLLLTILYCTRSLNLGVVPDLTPITTPGFPLQYAVGFKTNVVEFWKELSGRNKNISNNRILWKRFHMTSKSGPNGQGLWSSLQDLYCLPAMLIDSIKFLGGPEVSSHIDTLLALKSKLSLIFPIEGRSYRKVTWFPDKELKVRVIAILDYWSQTVLKPLHHWLFDCLKVIPQDCTFDQGSFYNKIKSSKVFYSIDLTAATDRFPIDYIGDVLEAKLGYEYVKHWKNIMVGYPFESKLGRLVYQVGNPMGAYSSWASFAVAHHFLVFTCIRDLGLQWIDVPYCLLGDDIVIGHALVAELYLSRIRALGVDVSPLKTHKSTSFFEFAKRLFWNGHEVTPFPISGLRSVDNRSYLLASFLMEVQNKGWSHVDGIPVAVDSYYNFVRHFPSRLRRKLKTQAYLVEQILKCIRGFQTATYTITSICWYLNRLRPLTDAWGDKHLFQTCALTLFTNKMPTNKENEGYPLGKLAEDLLIFLTGGDPKCETTSVLMMQAIYSLPILNVYGQIEEKYMAIHRVLHKDSFEEIDYVELFKIVALPLDDRVFVRRQSHLVVSAAHTFSKELLLQLDDFPFNRKISLGELDIKDEPLLSPDD